MHDNGSLRLMTRPSCQHTFQRTPISASMPIQKILHIIHKYDCNNYIVNWHQLWFQQKHYYVLSMSSSISLLAACNVITFMGIEVTLVWSNQNDITCLLVLLLQVPLNHNIQHFIWPSNSYITPENTYKSLEAQLTYNQTIGETKSRSWNIQCVHWNELSDLLLQLPLPKYKPQPNLLFGTIHACHSQIDA
jgi:hypothetical protein